MRFTIDNKGPRYLQWQIAEPVTDSSLITFLYVAGFDLQTMLIQCLSLQQEEQSIAIPFGGPQPRADAAQT